MIDLGTIVIYLGAFITLLIGSGLGGLIARLLYENYTSGSLERRITSLENKEKSIKGVAARQEKAERINMAMAEAVALQQSGTDIKDIVKTIAAKYPDIAFDLMKKVQKGGLI